MTDNLKEVAKAKAVNKGYDDGIAFLTEHRHCDYTYFLTAYIVPLSRAGIVTEHIEHYALGWRAAWDKMRPVKAPSMSDEGFPQSGRSYEQALMRDLEQS